MLLPIKKSVNAILTSAFFAAAANVTAVSAQDNSYESTPSTFPGQAEELLSNEFLREMLGFLDVRHFQLEDHPQNLMARIAGRNRILQQPGDFFLDQDDMDDLERQNANDMEDLVQWIRERTEQETPEMAAQFGAITYGFVISMVAPSANMPSNAIANCHHGVPVCHVISGVQTPSEYDRINGSVGITPLSTPEKFRVMDVWQALFEAAYTGQGHDCIEVSRGSQGICIPYYPDLTLMGIYAANAANLMTEDEMDNYFLLHLTRNVTRTTEFIAPYELMTYFYYLQGYYDGAETNERVGEALRGDLHTVRNHIQAQIVYNPSWGDEVRAELKDYLARVITGEQTLHGEEFSSEARFFAGAMLMMYERRGDSVPDLGDIPLYGHNLADFVHYLQESSTRESAPVPAQDLPNLIP